MQMWWLSLLWMSVPAAAQEGAALSPPAVFARQMECGQVTGMALDDYGRVWLAVTSRLGGRGVYACTTDQMHRDDLMVFSSAQRRTCLERWKAEGLLPAPVPEAPPGTGSLTENSERVVFLTDDNGDGTADTRRVFAEDFADALDGPAAAVLPLSGGAVLFGCTPALWRLEDDNRDGQADRRLPVLSGLGIRSGQGTSGLRVLTEGPDGFIYFATGDRGCRVTTSEGHRFLLEDTGGVFRCAPDGSGLELLATGLRDPAGMAMDLRGRLFVLDAGPEGNSRLLQILPGMDAGWDAALPQRGVFAAGPRPAWMVPERALLDFSASGLTLEATLDMAGRSTRLLAASGGIRGALVPLEVPETAGGEVTAAPPVWTGHAACAPVFAPDGALLWAEWEGGFTASAQCRILRRAPRPDAAWTQGAERLRKGLHALAPRELEPLMEHAHPLVRQRAREALAARGFEESLDVFTRIARRSPSLPARLNAVWGLAALSRAQPLLLGEIALLLTSPEAGVRAAAVQILGDSSWDGPPQEILALLRDPALEVRAAAAIAAGRLQLPGAAAAVASSLSSADAADAMLRQAFTFAMQRLLPPETLAATVQGTEAPAVKQCALSALRSQRSPLMAAFLKAEDRALAAQSAEAIYDLRIVTAFPALTALLAENVSPPWPPEVLHRALAAAQYLGTAEAAAHTAAVVPLTSLPALKMRALELLAAWDTPPEFDPLHGRYAPSLPREAGLARPHLTALTAAPIPGLDAAAESRFQQIAAQVSARPSIEQLTAAVKEMSLTETARIDALHRLAALQPAKAVELSRSQFPHHNTPRVLAAARALLLRLDAATAYEQIKETLASGSTQEMQAALVSAQRFDSKLSDSFWLETGRQLYLAKIPPPVRLEVMEALQQRDVAPRGKWRRLLEVLEADFAEDLDPLIRWRMCETGGDPDKGRAVFETSASADCLSCHSLNGRGGTSGPELDGIGRRRREPELLQSLLHPSAAIVPGYGRVTVALETGAQHHGLFRRRTSDTLLLETPRQILPLSASAVKELSPAESPMPSVSAILTPREIRDLIAFLAAQQ
jgi:quinoprotein glucose dehydrogenase